MNRRSFFSLLLAPLAAMLPRRRSPLPAAIKAYHSTLRDYLIAMRSDKPATDHREPVVPTVDVTITGTDQFGQEVVERLKMPMDAFRAPQPTGKSYLHD